MVNIKKQFLMTLIAFVLVSTAFSQDKGIGIGGYIQAGNTDEDGGLDMKIFLTRQQAIDIQLSIEMSPDFGDAIGVYGSYLIHWWDVLPINKGKLPLYAGPNFGVGIWDNGFALRFGAIGGMSFCLPPGTAPLDFYLQLNPVLEYKNDDDDNNNPMDPALYLQLGFRVFF